MMAKENTYGHLTEFLITPSSERKLCHTAEVLSPDAHTIPVRVKLEQDFFASKHEKIRVFRDQAVDDSRSF
jgi:hypothetical protein